ncbi:protease inhibitor I42 family protein [Methanococcus voltae]|jgi:inhibitor of cysteine peptidase|uniref:Proteinase inhibitor I42, chagasin n=1 Tax=Methanococcus voltae (strain ATCC BAA-1334 / A3) TaxID=456320 RepID=D7DTL0_METV3|nr:protease inhibitor I42 family protein [Methanococcus voltae]MCS3901322.1 inhibitor of cysteine peptidase [Methanococcus voltae]
MYKKLFMILAVVLAILMSGCVNEQPAGDINQSVNPDDTANSSKYDDVNITQHSEKMTYSITIPRFASIPIKLVENPSTGYTWNYTIEGDTDAIQITSDNYIPADSGLDGAPGTHVYEVEGMMPGTADIVFKYERNWENNSEVKEYTYTIKVISADRFDLEKDPNVVMKDASINTIKGEEMKISLPENPSTGYYWVVSNGAPKILNLVSSEFVSDKAETTGDAKETMVGVGGNRVWTYKGTDASEISLTFYLMSTAGKVVQYNHYDVYIDLKDAEKITENKTVPVSEEFMITHDAPSDYAGYAIEIQDKDIISYATVSNEDSALSTTWVFNATKVGSTKLIIRDYYGEESTTSEKITTYNIVVEDNENENGVSVIHSS